MALEVAVGAVVADHLERVDRGLERPARALAPVAAPAGPRRERGLAASGRRARPRAARTSPRSRPLAGHRACASTRASPSGSKSTRRTAGPSSRSAGGSSRPRGQLGRGGLAGAQVGAVGHAPVRAVDAGQERRDDLAQLAQQGRGALARLGQRVRAHPDEHRLVGLAGAEDAHVGRRGGRQQPAQQVEGRGARIARSRAAAGTAGSSGTRAPTCSTSRGSSSA